ncbi:MAG: hypothetical protein HYX24_01550 [Candidatus Aenigmarchaeota archaeon]|nr:hypothetical protein [Candidatus Aenigmarchaeota archaeon]
MSLENTAIPIVRRNFREKLRTHFHGDETWQEYQVKPPSDYSDLHDLERTYGANAGVICFVKGGTLYAAPFSQLLANRLVGDGYKWGLWVPFRGGSNDTFIDFKKQKEWERLQALSEGNEVIYKTFAGLKKLAGKASHNDMVLVGQLAYQTKGAFDSYAGSLSPGDPVEAGYRELLGLGQKSESVVTAKESA